MLADTEAALDKRGPSENFFRASQANLLNVHHHNHTMQISKNFNLHITQLSGLAKIYLCFFHLFLTL